MKKNNEYLLNELKDWIIVLWTLIQSTIGLLLVVVTGAEPMYMTIKNKQYKYYIAKRFNNTWTGVSLGEYIVFAKHEFVDEINVRHEYGHHTQSLILGPLYLILIGIPSFIGNIWDRIAHKNWSCLDRIAWYYTQPHEHWADSFADITLEDRGV